MNLPVILHYKLVDGALVPDGLSNQLKLDNYLQGLKEGQRVVLYAEEEGDEASRAQVNLFHKLCRIIAVDTGNGVTAIKSEIKRRCGFWEDPYNLQSTADLTKEDLDLLIKTVRELGEEYGINLFN